MTNKDALKKIQEVAENYTSKYMSQMPSNWTNGYMQAIRDVKVPFYCEDVEVNKNVQEIVERLEEAMRERILVAHYTSDVFVDGQANGIEWSIEIVKGVMDERD